MRRTTIAVALAMLVPLSAQAEDLLQTYRLARTSDPQLQQAEAGMRATKENAVQARAGLLPQIGASGSASASRSWSYSPSTTVVDPTTGTAMRVSGNSSSTVHQLNAGARVDQVVFNRAAQERLAAARAQGTASEYNYEAAGDALITRTSQAYFNVLVAIETLAAARAQESALKKQFDFASKRLEVGLAPITDVHEARAQYEGARANTILQQNALEDAYQALAEITGQPVRTLMALPDDFRPALPAEGGMEDWVKRATDGNPSLQAQRYQIQAADSYIAAARAGYLPTVNAYGSLGTGKTWSSRDGAGGGSFSSPWQHGPGVGISLNWPIFNGGMTASQVRQAIAQRDQQQDVYEQQRRSIERSVRNAYQGLSAGVSAVEARRLALVAAQSAYDASLVGLEVGTRTVIDVLLNQQNLFNAQQAFSLAKYNYLQSQLVMRQAAGTLDVEDVAAVNRLLTVPAGDVPRIGPRTTPATQAAPASSNTRNRTPRRRRRR